MNENNPMGTPLGSGTQPVEKRKVSKSETGHAINVANFEDLISICIGFGTAYNPSKNAITITALQAKRTQALNALKSIDDLLPASINAINNREIAFNSFESIIRRIKNAVEASDVTAQFIKDVKTITRKLLGTKSKTKQPENPDTNALENLDATKTHSSAQTSMDNRIENFYKLITLLNSNPNYNPNETDLTITALTTYYNTLIALNTTVINANIPVKNARIQRNVFLYHPETGLVRLASDVKKYVKSVFGVSSPQYKQMSKIKFKPSADLANKVK